MEDDAARRAAYARKTMELAKCEDPAVEAAFAAIRREDFLGSPPWHTLRGGGTYEPTSDPDRLYSNDLFGLIPERGLNNGQPSLHATLLHRASPKPGEHAVHI